MKSTDPHIVISSRVHAEVIDALSRAGTVVGNQTDNALTQDELLRRCRDASALMAFMPERIDDAFLAACPRLRIVACALKGYDNFDVAACSRHGVWLTIVPDLLTAPTAELTIGLMIALARNVLPGDRLVRSGRFQGWRPILYGRGIDGSTVGLLGAGAVGKAVARRLAGFRARLLYADATPLTPDQEDDLRLQRVTPDELSRLSDFVVLCLPLSERTRHLVDRGFLARLKPSAFLINTARGSLVDEDAVADALAAGTLAGYAADVFAMEDWALADRPDDVPDRLRSAIDRTVLTPHLGSAVDDVRRSIALQAAASVLECLRGEVPSGAVNQPANDALSSRAQRGIS
ncbi:MAG TPA: phosphonate dehydrogenase [Vineibacter sp.]|nr:phosphonate dehydrogenase [Vineibacter sp.]